MHIHAFRGAAHRRVFIMSPSHSPCRPSGLHPPGQAQRRGPALCPEREASSSSPLPSASAAGWGWIAVDGLWCFLLCSRWSKCPPLSPWFYRCPQCEVGETGQVAAGPPRRPLSAPLCLPWRQRSEQAMLQQSGSSLPTYVWQFLLQCCCLH